MAHGKGATRLEERSKGSIPAGVGSSAESVAGPWHALALAGVLAIAALMSFFRLAQEGYGNLYYAATVKSMLTSWHNFSFVSFDPSGFVTVDKPPLGLWIQAASAALLGFEGTHLLLPQAVAGVLAVALLHHLVRRTFGPTAGLLAALILAVTPIHVAASRNNTMDSVLVVFLLLAAWAVLRAAETGRLRWLLLCAALVGLGFNVKMLQAYLVLPALCLLYLLAPPLPWWKRAGHLALAAVVLLAVSLSWAVVVDLTPAEQRPYIGSTQDNTVLELVVGHNGLKRLLPGGLRALSSSQQRAPQGPPSRPGVLSGGQDSPLPAAAANPPPSGGVPAAPIQGPGQPFQSEVGRAGVLRLFNRQLAGQISWLLPLAVLGLVVAARQVRQRLPLDHRHQSLLLWGVWLATQMAFFSVANLFHRYYLNIMAPAIAALAAIGLVALWNQYREQGWRGWLLPLALLASAGVQASILSEFPEWSRWLTPLIAGGCLLSALALVAARWSKRLKRATVAAALAAVGVVCLLIAPMVWAWIPVWYGGHAGLPYAGPDLLTEPRHNEMQGIDTLVEYLQGQDSGEYLLATVNARDAAPFILATGEPVMALGGFSGNDPILTVEQLEEFVHSGKVRFFLLTPGARQQQDLTEWVVQNCGTVDPRLWMPRSSRPFGPRRGPMPQLLDAYRHLTSVDTGFDCTM